MGFGLGVAVLIDATIVRSVLVPASMKLLGNRNWYLPRWPEWLTRLQVDAPEGVHLAGAGAGGGQAAARSTRPPTAGAGGRSPWRPAAGRSAEGRARVAV